MVTEVKKMTGYHRVTFSDGASLRVPEALFYDFKVRTGDQVDRASYEALLSSHAYEYALDRAARALTARDATEKEIEKKLLSAGYPEQAVARVMEVLTRYEFISDERYAERYISSRSSRYGRGRILTELRRKGVEEETVRQALEALSPEDEAEAALAQARKLCARRDLSDRADRQKAVAALVRRGFSWSLAAQAVQRLSGREDDEEGGWEDP